MNYGMDINKKLLRKSYGHLWASWFRRRTSMDFWTDKTLNLFRSSMCMWYKVNS